MSLCKRAVVVGLALAFVLSLLTGAASAATKKKKESKSESKKEPRRVTSRSGLEPIDGSNMSAKPGYFISDTAKTLEKGQIMGSGHLTFDTWGSVLQVPVGVSYGITDKITVNVNSAFYYSGGYTYTTPFGSYTGPSNSGIYYLNFGGKYGFGRVTKGLDIAAGLDFSIGPLSNNIFGYSAFGFDPYGVATFTLPDGLQFNGKLGLYVQSYGVPTGLPAPFPSSISFSYSYFQLDLGAAYPFDKNLTGIAELATNGVVTNGALGGGTPLLVGIRTGNDVQFQAFGGLDLGGVVGLFVGGGVVLMSK